MKLAARAWQPPPSFDGYELLGSLGTGGMGNVFRAHEPGRGRDVAIKLITLPEQTPHARERFAIEIRALARVRHPNVVRIFRAGTVDGRPYFAQELLDGERLDELSRPTSWRRVLAIGLGLARAVAAAHANGVVHRDIKPGNVMLVRGDRVKLFDFGLAWLADAAHHRRSGRADPWSVDARLTAHGGIVGTPAYLAPELWDRGDASVRSDAYSLGLVLYELLVGALPDRDLPSPQLADRVRAHDLPPVASTRPDVPPALAAIIDRCVARDPDRRPPSVAAIREAFDDLVRDRETDHVWTLDDTDERRAAHDDLPTEPLVDP